MSAKLWEEMLRRSFDPVQWYAADDDDRGTPEVRIMWVYRRVESVYCVGYYSPDGEWNAESDYSTPGAAAQRVHWLNGGS